MLGGTNRLSVAAQPPKQCSLLIVLMHNSSTVDLLLQPNADEHDSCAEDRRHEDCNDDNDHCVNKQINDMHVDRGIWRDHPHHTTCAFVSALFACLASAKL